MIQIAYLNKCSECRHEPRCPMQNQMKHLELIHRDMAQYLDFIPIVNLAVACDTFERPSRTARRRSQP